MFSRRPDRPREEPRFAPGSGSSRPAELVAVPVPDQPAGSWGGTLPSLPDGRPGMAGGDPTVIAERDHVEGHLRSGQGVLILGSFSGTIESDSWVRMGVASTVTADVTADEVVVAGQYEGKLVARGRLEVVATGHVRGEIEAPRLQLHEGGIIDGVLFMSRTQAGRQGVAPRSGPSAKASVHETGADPGSLRKGRASTSAAGSGAGPRGGAPSAGASSTGPESSAAAAGPGPDVAVPALEAPSGGGIAPTSAATGDKPVPKGTSRP
jgi:cytoskeletal protein CcmA (bactofilin family)